MTEPSRSISPFNQHRLEGRLGAIRQYALLILDGIDDAELSIHRSIAVDVRKILKLAEESVAIIEEVFSIQPVVQPVTKRAIIRNLVTDALYLVVFPQSIQVNIFFGEEVAEVIAPMEISDIIHNLIMNGIEAMQGVGVLDIKVSSHSPSAVCIAFTDSGCGVPDNVREHLFIKYISTKTDANPNHGRGLYHSRANC